MATQINQKIINVLSDRYASEESIDKYTILTREGSRKFNENFFRNDRKIIITGLKVGQLINPEESHTSTTSAHDLVVTSKTKMISEDSAKGIILPSNTFIPPNSMSTEDSKDSKDSKGMVIGTRLLMSFTFSKDTLYQYNNPTERYNENNNGTIQDLTRIHEIGIYAQIFQKANPYLTGVTYEIGDIVSHSYTPKEDVDPIVGIYRAIESTSLEPTASNPEWQRLIGGGFDIPLKGNRMVDDYWVPVLNNNVEDPPFLLYYVLRPENPLYIEFGHTISYTTAIDLLQGAQLDSFYTNQEDSQAFPEIQLAYLTTLAASHRYARDIFRENEVLRGSRGQWNAGSSYEINDIVVSTGWVGYDRSYSGWGDKERLWKCLIPHETPQIPGQAHEIWEEIDILTNRANGTLQEIVFK